MMKNTIVIVLLALLFQSCAHNGNNQGDVGQKDSQTTKVGIAFGGGGAKAAAEIGVLKTIEKAGLRVDYVAGTSMGAVIGGLYAAGYSAHELDSLMTTEEWLSLFDENEIGITEAGNDRTVFGLVKGDVFEDYLRQALLKKGCKNIGDTKKVSHVTFACIASNIVTKNDLSEVVLKQDDVDMARAIRASMTFPAPLVGYKPISLNGMLLVDGGMLNNLPVDVVKDMGAEKVIAIDLERGNKKERKLALGGLVNLGWLVKWLIDHPDREKHNRNFDMADVKIRPDLLGYSILSFNEIDFHDMMLLGEDDAKTYHWEELMELKK